MRLPLVVAVLFLASPAHAQQIAPSYGPASPGWTGADYAVVGDPSKPYDFEKPLSTYVDVATKAKFEGWSGDCNSGRMPSTFTLYRIDRGKLVNVPVTVTTGARPDAAAYLAAACGRPFDTTVGWSLVPKTPEPDGSFEYLIWVTDLPTSWTCNAMPPGYPNSGQIVCDYVSNVVYRIVN